MVGVCKPPIQNIAQIFFTYLMWTLWVAVDTCGVFPGVHLNCELSPSCTFPRPRLGYEMGMGMGEGNPNGRCNRECE